MSEKDFCAVRFFKPHANAPEWVIGKIVIDVPAFIKQHEKHLDSEGKVTIDVKVSKAGNEYTAYDDWKLNKTPSVEQPKEDISDTPF